MNFSGFGVWPSPGVWPFAGATAPNVRPPANAAPLLRNPRPSDFMGLSFTDEPGKKSLLTVESIGEQPQPQNHFVKYLWHSVELVDRLRQLRTAKEDSVADEVAVDRGLPEGTAHWQFD